MQQCKEIDDKEEYMECKAKAEATHKAMKENCYDTEPTCEEKAKLTYSETVKECDAIDDPEEKENCYKQAKVTFKEDLEQCECHERALAWFNKEM
jgi:hypothetical protein